MKFDIKKMLIMGICLVWGATLLLIFERQDIHFNAKNEPSKSFVTLIPSSILKVDVQFISEDPSKVNSALKIKFNQSYLDYVLVCSKYQHLSWFNCSISVLVNSPIGINTLTIEGSKDLTKGAILSAVKSLNTGFSERQKNLIYYQTVHYSWDTEINLYPSSPSNKVTELFLKNHFYGEKAVSVKGDDKTIIKENCAKNSCQLTARNPKGMSKLFIKNHESLNPGGVTITNYREQGSINNNNFFIKYLDFVFTYNILVLMVGAAFILYLGTKLKSNQVNSIMYANTSFFLYTLFVFSLNIASTIESSKPQQQDQLLDTRKNVTINSFSNVPIKTITVYRSVSPEEEENSGLLKILKGLENAEDLNLKKNTFQKSVSCIELNNKKMCSLTYKYMHEKFSQKFSINNCDNCSISTSSVFNTFSDYRGHVLYIKLINDWIILGPILLLGWAMALILMLKLNFKNK